MTGPGTSGTAGAARAPGCSTEDMRLVHAVFRAVFTDAPALVDGVAVGDVRRADAVGRHLLEMSRSLHHHHATEDLLLWDVLESRAPACALHVGLMKRQHAAMADLLSEAEEALPLWMGTASGEHQRRVRSAVVAVDASMREHLGDEERRVLPPASSVMMQREWSRLGAHARKQGGASMLFPQIGFMFEAVGPEEGQRLLTAVMPAPVRLLWRLVGRRQYRRYRDRVHGTA